MSLPTQVLLTMTQAATSATEDPPAPPPNWWLPITALAAAFLWWVHWRWRTGGYFMSRYTTAEREKAKLALYGPPALPAAIGCTAATAMLALWEFWGSPTNAWSGLVFLTLAAVVVGAGGWTAKEWWRSQQATATRLAAGTVTAIVQDLRRVSPIRSSAMSARLYAAESSTAAGADYSRRSDAGAHRTTHRVYERMAARWVSTRSTRLGRTFHGIEVGCSSKLRHAIGRRRPDP
jgi:MYXO-CTERM domain-containing protein